MQKVIFEGDAKTVIEAVKSVEENMSVLSPLIDDIRNVLKNRKDWLLQSVYRERNKVNHTLAKATLSFVEEKVCIEEDPDCIAHGLEHDRRSMQ